MADTSFDIIIIGSGPGGYVAAIRRAARYKTPLSRSPISAASAELGCIPTKALLPRGIFSLYAAREGLRAVGRERLVRRKAVVQRSRGVSKRLNDASASMRKTSLGDLGRGRDRPPGKDHHQEIRHRAPKGAWRGPIRPSISSLPPERGRACCRTRADKKLIWTYFERWCPTRCRSRCWWWLRRDRIEFASFLPHHGH